MWSIGMSEGQFVLFTDSALSSGGMTKVTLSRDDAEAMVAQAAFLLRSTGAAAPSPSAVPLYPVGRAAWQPPLEQRIDAALARAPARPLSPVEEALEDASFANATNEAADADAQAIAARERAEHEARQQKREEEREMRRIEMARRRGESP